MYLPADTHNRSWEARFAGIFILLTFFCACSPGVGVVPVDMAAKYQQADYTALDRDLLSERTVLLLRHYDLLDSYRSDPEQTALLLDQKLEADPNRRLLFALMEICFIEARSQTNTAYAARMNLSCSVYSYAYLFDPSIATPPDVFHPNFRNACDFYNRSLAAFFVFIRDHQIKLALQQTWELLNGSLEFTGYLSEMQWDLNDFDRFYFANEYDVLGVTEHHRGYGLGVPLIATITMPLTTKKDSLFLAPIQHSYAATVFVRIKKVAAAKGKSQIRLHATIELYNTVTTDSTLVGGQTVPLEMDLTTPLAHLFSKTPVPSAVSGMLDIDSWADRGLYMFQPYNPDKIPVVFVHGVLTSDLTWVPMFNNLLADRRLMDRYQFFFFEYPAGNPVWLSAAKLRHSLEKIRQTFATENTRSNFDKMVLVGHSMGGLIAKLQVMEDSDKRFWNEVFTVSREELPIDPEGRRFLKELFEYEPLDFISSIVFISVPHRGTTLVSDPLIAAGASQIRIVDPDMQNLYHQLKDLQTLGRPVLKRNLTQMPTGILNLHPNSPFVQVTTQFPLPADVTYHSIIGNLQSADTIGGTDGIVTYDSAHLEEAVTEKIVKSDHSAHATPGAIQEVRRILLEHLKNTDSP